MRQTAAIILVAAFAILLTGGLVHASPGAIANGIGWLRANQNPSGD